MAHGSSPSVSQEPPPREHRWAGHTLTALHSQSIHLVFRRQRHKGNTCQKPSLQTHPSESARKGSQMGTVLPGAAGTAIGTTGQRTEPGAQHSSIPGSLDLDPATLLKGPECFLGNRLLLSYPGSFIHSPCYHRPPPNFHGDGTHISYPASSPCFTTSKWK